MQLRLATEAEKLERDRLTYAEWGTGLSLEAYLEREQRLRAHPFSRGMRTWLLTGADQVLASCETFENASRLGAELGRTASFASVFTEPALRGRGHATSLMDAVLAQLEQEPGWHAAVLFSDVGERIYARSGFAPAGAAEDWVFLPSAGPAPTGVVCAASPPAAPPAVSTEPGTLELLPSEEQLDWALAREAMYARFFSRLRPGSHHARCGAASASWAVYFKSNELVVLWLTPGSASETDRVLAMARHEASRVGVGRVRMWALPGVPLPTDGFVEKRKGELPMVRALGPRSVERWLQVQRAVWV